MIFALVAIPAAAGVEPFEVAAVVTSLTLFAVSLGIWVWAFGIAVVAQLPR